MSNVQSTNAQNTPITPATIAEAITKAVPTQAGPFPMPTELGTAVYMQHGDVVTISFQVAPSGQHLSPSGKSWTRFKAMTAQLADLHLQVLGYTSVPKNERKAQ